MRNYESQQRQFSINFEISTEKQKSEIRNTIQSLLAGETITISRILTRAGNCSVLDETRLHDSPARWNSSFPVNARIATAGILGALRLCARRYWYKQGAGPVWSVLCNQAPITIEGGQSSWWTERRCSRPDTTFSAVLFQLFTTMVESVVVEKRLLTLVSGYKSGYTCLWAQVTD